MKTYVALVGSPVGTGQIPERREVRPVNVGVAVDDVEALPWACGARSRPWTYRGRIMVGGLPFYVQTPAAGSPATKKYGPRYRLVERDGPACAPGQGREGHHAGRQ